MSDFEGSSRREEGTTAAVAHTAQEKASRGAGLVGGKATEVAGTARQQAAGVAGEATSQAKGLVNDVRTQLQEQAQSQTERLAQNVRRLADELEDMSRNAKSDSSAAGVVGQVADGGHRMASHLETRGPDGLVSDLQEFARRRPAVFLAGAAVAGFAVGRVGKGVKAAGGGSTRAASGSRAAGRDSEAAEGDMPAPGSPDAGTPLPTTGPEYAGADPAERYGQSQPPHLTPSYGGSVAPGPVRATDAPQERPQGS